MPVRRHLSYQFLIIIVNLNKCQLLPIKNCNDYSICTIYVKIKASYLGLIICKQKETGWSEIVLRPSVFAKRFKRKSGLSRLTYSAFSLQVQFVRMLTACSLTSWWRTKHTISGKMRWWMTMSTVAPGFGFHRFKQDVQKESGQDLPFHCILFWLWRQILKQ